MDIFQDVSDHFQLEFLQLILRWIFGEYSLFVTQKLSVIPAFLNLKLSKSQLLKPITSSYGLRFERTTRPRTRFDELYNFREGSFSQILDGKKLFIITSPKL